MFFGTSEAARAYKEEVPDSVASIFYSRSSSYKYYSTSKVNRIMSLKIEDKCTARHFVPIHPNVISLCYCKQHDLFSKCFEDFDIFSSFMCSISSRAVIGNILRQ